MEKSRGKTIIIVILVLVVLGLGGYIVYDKVITKDENNNEIKSLKAKINELKTVNNEDNSNDRINSIVGEYIYTQNNENGPSWTITVDFMEDGTYYEKVVGTAAEIIYGTYSISNDDIKLNQLFTHSNEQANGKKLNETYISKLNNDGTINWISSVINQEKIVLTKNDKRSDVKKELMDWLMNDVVEYNKSLTN